MAILWEMRRHARHIVAPVLGASILGYFAYHAVQGDRGLIAWLQLSQQIRQAQETLDRLSSKRQVLETRVSLLRPDHLDPDMLDEQTRVMLGLAGPDELVVIAPGRGKAVDGNGGSADPLPKK